MQAVKIYPPFVYAIRYQGDTLNIYRLISKRLQDPEYLEKFFEEFHDKISDYIVNTLGIPKNEIEEYGAEVNDRILDIDDEIKKICEDICVGNKNNFGNYFFPHSNYDFRNLPDGGGKSKKYLRNYLPVKCYGEGQPKSIVRLYAIEFSLDCYLIFYGGIKITLDTNESPTFDDNGNITDLESEIEKRYKEVCDFLKEKGIIDKDGLIDYMKEEL